MFREPVAVGRRQDDRFLGRLDTLGTSTSDDLIGAAFCRTASASPTASRTGNHLDSTEGHRELTKLT